MRRSPGPNYYEQSSQEFPDPERPDPAVTRPSKTRRRTRRAFALLRPAGVAALVACGPTSGSRSPQPVPETDPCLLAPDQTAALRDTITIVVFDPIRPTLLLTPINAAERLVGRQLYDGLIRVDCRGKPMAGLAESWSSIVGVASSDVTEATWTLKLRAGAMLSDGLALDAHAIQTSWEYQRTGNSLPSTDVVSSVVIDPKTIQVRLVGPEARLAQAFGRSELAIGGRRFPDGRPAESGAFRLVDPVPASPGGSVNLLMLANRVNGVRPSIVRIVSAPPGVDPRDALDHANTLRGGSTADILITRDPNTLAYARTRPDFRVVALPWDMTYTLITAPGLEIRVIAAAGERDALARDAVRGEARGAQGPYWWTTNESSCVSNARVSPAPLPVVAYRQGDATGRELAERIVALATAPTGLRVAPFSPTALDSAVASGSVATAVVAYPRLWQPHCDGRTRYPAGATMIPLVDTRAHVVVRRGAPAIGVEADGSIRLLLGRP